MGRPPENARKVRSERPVVKRMVTLYADQTLYWDTHHLGNMSERFRDIMDMELIPPEFHEDVRDMVSKLILAMMSNYNTDKETIKDVSLDIYNKLRKDYVITPFQVMYFLVEKGIY